MAIFPWAGAHVCEADLFLSAIRRGYGTNAALLSDILATLGIPLADLTMTSRRWHHEERGRTLTRRGRRPMIALALLEASRPASLESSRVELDRGGAEAAGDRVMAPR